MKKKTLAILVLLIVAGSAVAQEFAWPSSPCDVNIGGDLIPVYWKDGRPFINRLDAIKYFKISDQGEAAVDLVETLKQIGWTARAQNGGVQIRNPKITSVGGGTRNPAARLLNSGASSELEQYRANKAYEEATRPKLVVYSTKYVAETGYVRALVVIRNEGGGPSQPCQAIGQFIDWFGKPYAQEIKPLGALAPGESVETTFFSMLTDKEALEKSDKITCRVTFK